MWYIRTARRISSLALRRRAGGQTACGARCAPARRRRSMSLKQRCTQRSFPSAGADFIPSTRYLSRRRVASAKGARILPRRAIACSPLSLAAAWQDATRELLRTHGANEASAGAMPQTPRLHPRYHHLPMPPSSPNAAQACLAFPPGARLLAASSSFVALHGHAFSHVIFLRVLRTGARSSISAESVRG